MKVYLRNIQGFKGEFTFDIGHSVVNITSELNGTGKTTFFDCMKLLCNPHCFTSEELRFIIHKRCSSGEFRIYDDIMSYGFTYNRKHLVYIREFIDVDTETSHEPFSDVADYLGIFMYNGEFVNICDRFISLFSSSKEDINFELVDLITNHAKANEMMKLNEESIKLHQSKLRTISDKAHKVARDLGDSTCYANVDKFEDLITKSVLIDLHDSMILLRQEFAQYVPTSPAISADLVIGLRNLFIDITAFNPVGAAIRQIDFVKLLGSNLEATMKFIPTAQSIPPNPIIDSAILLYNDVARYSPVTYHRMLSLSLATLLKDFSSFVPASQCIQVDFLSTFHGIYIDFLLLHANHQEILLAEEFVRTNREFLTTYKHHCQRLGKDVYVLEGRCISEGILHNSD